MDREVRLTLIEKLLPLALRKPRPFDPPGCGYCGAGGPFVRGTLCGPCVARLDRLEVVDQAPRPPSDFTTFGSLATFVSTDPRFQRRSDDRLGGRRTKLPFDDNAA